MEERPERALEGFRGKARVEMFGPFLFREWALGESSAALGSRRLRYLFEIEEVFCVK